MKTRSDDVDAGFLICLSHLIGGHGVGTEAVELFKIAGSPSAKRVRELGLPEYDRENLAQVRKAAP